MHNRWQCGQCVTARVYMYVCVLYVDVSVGVALLRGMDGSTHPQLVFCL